MPISVSNPAPSTADTTSFLDDFKSIKPITDDHISYLKSLIHHAETSSVVEDENQVSPDEHNHFSFEDLSALKHEFSFIKENNPHDDPNAILPELNKDDYSNGMPAMEASSEMSLDARLNQLNQRKDLLTKQLGVCSRAARQLLDELEITELKISSVLHEAGLSPIPTSSSSAAGPSNSADHLVLNKEPGTSEGGLFGYHKSGFSNPGAVNKEEQFIKRL